MLNHVFIVAEGETEDVVHPCDLQYILIHEWSFSYIEFEFARIFNDHLSAHLLG